MRSSFNGWEANNLIGGQKYVIVMTILKYVTERALQSRNLRSFCIGIKFVPNPVSCEKNLPKFCVKY